MIYFIQPLPTMPSIPHSDQERSTVSQYMRLFAEVVANRTGRVSDSASSVESLTCLGMGIVLMITILFNRSSESFGLSGQPAMDALFTVGVTRLASPSVVLASPIHSPIGVQPTASRALLCGSIAAYGPDPQEC